MKGLRYLLTIIGALSVVSATAVTYGTMYQPQRYGSQYTSSYTQMPSATMHSTGSAMMTSGSALPLAVVNGTTTADDYIPIGPRRAKMEEGNPFDNGSGGTLNIGETGTPNEPGTPVGDAVWPLMLFALAYAGYKVLARRKALKG